AQVAVLARADLLAAAATRRLAIGDDARPRRGAFVVRTIALLEEANDQLVDAADDVGDEASHLVQHAAHVVGQGSRVVAGAVLPLACDLAGEVARMLGDALAESLRVARDAAREFFRGVAAALAAAVSVMAVPVRLATVMGHDGCSFWLAGSRS